MKKEKGYKNTVTIPLDTFMVLVEKSARLDMFCQIINSNTIYSKDDLLSILGKEKSPADDQSNAGLEKNFLDEL